MVELKLVLIIYYEFYLVMRLSKKSKESDNKRETVEGLTRLVCTSRYHNIPLDGKYLKFNYYHTKKIINISIKFLF